MENKLPVKVENKTVVTKVKNGSKKAIKILGSGILAFGFCIGIVASGAIAPILIAPMMVGSVFSMQNFLNNTKYTSYKDLAFITAKHKGNTKIYQDVTRIDMTSKIRDLSDTEKVGFMQLQTLIGLTKFKPIDKKGREITFETDTHSINQKTFRKLQELGYIKDYEEKYLKNTRLVLPKLAFGNIKGMKKKVKIYNVKFKLTGKPVNLDDADLRRYFPMVFGEKNGIIAKKGYNFIKEQDGILTIDYNPKQPYIESKVFPKRRENNLKARLKEGMPSLEEQKKKKKKKQNERNRQINSERRKRRFKQVI